MMNKERWKHKLSWTLLVSFVMQTKRRVFNADEKDLVGFSFRLMGPFFGI